MVLVWYATQVTGSVPGAIVESTASKELAALEEQLDKAIALGEWFTLDPPPRRMPPE
jgi:hypothetical protein